MLHDDEYIDGFEEQAGRGGEITSPHFMGMILEKCGPVLTRSFSYLLHVFLDGSLADFDAEFEQLALNLLGTPEPVFLSHFLDKINCFLGDTWLPVFRPGFAFPVTVKEFAMPAEDCLWLNQM